MEDNFLGRESITTEDHFVEKERIKDGSEVDKIVLENKDADETCSKENGETEAEMTAIENSSESTVDEKFSKDKDLSETCRKGKKYRPRQLTFQSLLRRAATYQSWFKRAASLVAVLILFTTSILLMLGDDRRESLPADLTSLQGSMKIFSANGQSVKYSNKLKYIDNIASISLRHILEPKLEDVYKQADLDVRSVYIYAFKYDAAGVFNVGRAANVLQENTSKDFVSVRHMVYLNFNATLPKDDLLSKVKKSAQESINLKVEVNSISLVKQWNVSLPDVPSVSSKEEFIQKSLLNLDMMFPTAVNESYGLVNLSLQTSSNILCPSLLPPVNGFVYPPECEVSNKIFFGMICSFKCNATFALGGSSKRVCISTGYWSGIPASCSHNCMLLPPSNVLSVKPRTCMSLNNFPGQLCVLLCSASHVLDSAVNNGLEKSSSFRECFTTETWSASVGSCKAKCPRLILHEHQYFSSKSSMRCHSQPIEGDICIVECNVGFLFESQCSAMQLTCDVFGIWNRPLLQCRRTCIPIKKTIGLRVHPTLCEKSPFQGMKCLFSCDPKYKILGVGVSTCTLNGLWDVAQSTCTPVCPVLQQALFGTIVTLRGSCVGAAAVSGSECKFVCKTGFFSSNTKSVCVNGKWSVSSWSCRRKCQPLGEVPFGHWYPSTCRDEGHHTDHKNCSFECDKNYQAVGHKILTCKADSGQWSALPGECKVVCPALTKGNASKHSRSNCTGAQITGTICKLWCGPLYLLQTPKYVICLDNGTWSFSGFIACKRWKKFLILHQSPYSTACITLDGNNVPVLERVINGVQCTIHEVEDHWVFFGTYGFRHAVSGLCLRSSAEKGLLEAVNCNGNDKYQRFYGRNRWIRQSYFYLVLGYPVISRPLLFPAIDHDQTKAKWWIWIDEYNGHRTFGNYENELCDKYPITNDMTYASRCYGYTVKWADFLSFKRIVDTFQRCYIQCSYGVLNIPDIEVECVYGDWHHYGYVLGVTLSCIVNGNVYGCQPYDTKYLHDAKMLPLDCTLNRQVVGTDCTVECVYEGEYVHGLKTVTCLNDGSWFPGGVSICTSHCPSIHLKTNSFLMGLNVELCKTNKSKLGDVCQIACEEGFHLQGKSSLTCLLYGTWSDPPPTCTSRCSALEVGRYVKVQCSNPMNRREYDIGTKCTFSCHNDFVMSSSGSKSMECQSDHSWKPENVPVCRPTCPVLKSSKNQLISPKNCTLHSSNVGDTCYVSCDAGSALSDLQGAVNKTILVCSEDGTWLGPVPLCIGFCPALIPSRNQTDGHFIPEGCQHTALTVGSSCSLFCNDTYHALLGATNAFCSFDGIWVFDGGYSDFGICLLTCEPFPLSKHSYVLPEACIGGGAAIPGTACIIMCPENMHLEGPAIRTCLGFPSPSSYLSWSGGHENTHCRAICHPLRVQPLTIVLPPDCTEKSSVEGTTCLFECPGGLLLTGSSVLTCTSSGTWSSLQPLCQHFCGLAQVPYGYVNCFSSPYVYPLEDNLRAPGAKCTYTCDKGFVPYPQNTIVCMEPGIWNPEPKCKPVLNTFSILQKIGIDMKCIMANQTMTNMEWVVSFGYSSEDCLSARNNAIWLWRGHLLVHVGSGLCLTADMKNTDSELSLSVCDKSEYLQQWDCEAFHPYRIVLKSTDLGIDSVYEVHPVLQTYVHEKSFWISFNDQLESIASVCSYRDFGVCPPLRIPHVITKPSVCLTNYVTMWQKCILECDSGMYFRGNFSLTTQCLPTGVWEGIEKAQCLQNCTRLTTGSDKTYTPASCSTEDIAPFGACNASCNFGYEFPNGESQMILTCVNGLWSSKDISCKPKCDAPIPPENASVQCDDEFCTFTCHPGYSPLPANASMVMKCADLGKYNKTKFVCKHGSLFRIRVRILAILPYEVCLASSSLLDSGLYETRKVFCNSSDVLEYWLWETNSIVHFITGMCLMAKQHSSSSVLVLSSCDGSKRQQWKYLSSIYPFHIISASTQEFIDLGSNDVNTPAVLHTGYPKVTGEWIALDVKDNEGTLPSFKTKGGCPALIAGPGTSLSDSCSMQESSVGNVCRPTCATGYSSSSTPFSLECLKSGMWSGVVMPCISLDCNKTELLQSATGKLCSKIVLSVGLLVRPSICSSEVRQGTRCDFSCWPNYFLEGVKVVHCGDFGVWSDQIPTCKGHCVGLHTTAAVVISPPICTDFLPLFGTTCTQKCGHGFGSINQINSIRRCNPPSGAWSGNDLKCQSGCPSLSAAPYMATSNSALVTSGNWSVATSGNCSSNVQVLGRTCFFHCPPGFELVDGSEYATCGSGNKWIQRIPRCVPQFACPAAKTYGALSIVYEPMKGAATVVPGTALFLICAVGFVVDGDDERLCTSSGKWDGVGPDIPACSQQCPPILPAMTTGVSPPECSTQNSKAGQLCYLLCTPGNTFQSGEIAQVTTCAGGKWSLSITECRAKKTLDAARSAFLMITRSPRVGCLILETNNYVKWSDKCSLESTRNKWKWNEDARTISNDGKCLKPKNTTSDYTKLIAADCDSESLHVRCGNPVQPDSNLRLAIYVHNKKRWYLGYELDSLSSLPSSVVLTKIPSAYDHVPLHNFKTIVLSGNVDVQRAPETDKTICSYSCVKIVINSSQVSHIYTPEYLEKMEYSPYTNCEWIIQGYNRRITLHLIKLDLEEASDPSLPCTTDCLQVYRGHNRALMDSELIATFSGNKLSAYLPDKNYLQLVVGNFYVHFKSNGATEGKGFLMQFKYTNIVTPSLCGKSQNNNNIENTWNPLTNMAKKVDIGKWPWLVSIREKGNRKASHRCTGVLVNENMVVSAAHCARYFVDALKKNSSLQLGFGVSSQMAMDGLHDEAEWTADRVFVHPHYDYHSRKYDIAVWTLAKQTRFSTFIQPICLPVTGYPVHSVYSVCYAVGWTKLDNGANSNDLFEHVMNIDSATWCDEEMGLFSENQFLCASYAALDSSGLAGSGSSEPLMCQFNGSWYLTGIAAYTHTGSRIVRRFYTDIHSNGKWLSKTLSRTATVSYRSKGLDRIVSMRDDLVDHVGDADKWFRRF